MAWPGFSSATIHTIIAGIIDEKAFKIFRNFDQRSDNQQVQTENAYKSTFELNNSNQLLLISFSVSIQLLFRSYSVSNQPKLQVEAN